MPPKHHGYMENDYHVVIFILNAVEKKMPAEWSKDVGCFCLKLLEGVDLELRGNDGKQVHHLYGPLLNFRSVDPLGGCSGKEDWF